MQARVPQGDHVRVWVLHQSGAARSLQDSSIARPMQHPYTHCVAHTHGSNPTQTITTAHTPPATVATASLRHLTTHKHAGSATPAFCTMPLVLSAQRACHTQNKPQQPQPHTSQHRLQALSISAPVDLLQHSPSQHPLQWQMLAGQGQGQS